MLPQKNLKGTVNLSIVDVIPDFIGILTDVILGCLCVFQFHLQFYFRSVSSFLIGEVRFVSSSLYLSYSFSFRLYLSPLPHLSLLGSHCRLLIFFHIVRSSHLFCSWMTMFFNVIVSSCDTLNLGYQLFCVCLASLADSWDVSCW